MIIILKLKVNDSLMIRAICTNHQTVQNRSNIQPTHRTTIQHCHCLRDQRLQNNKIQPHQAAKEKQQSTEMQGAIGMEIADCLGQQSGDGSKIYSVRCDR